MASKMSAATILLMIMLVVLAAAHVTEADDTCSDPFKPLEPCLVSLVGESPPAPSAACCTAVQDANLPCLCQAVKNGTPPKGLQINVQAAEDLVKTCKRDIPPNFKC